MTDGPAIAAPGALSLLPAAARAAIGEIAAALAAVRGVVGVVLGGSHARGAARPDSDVDLGVYYRHGSPPRVGDVRAVVERFAAAPPTVTGFYEWGPWVNGGAWLETAVGRVDLLYRELDHVARVIAAARRGEIEWHFGQQPPYGFRSVIYLAETAVCAPLHDPQGAIATLKKDVAQYPEALRRAIVQGSLWSAEFTHWNGTKLAARGDVYATAGCATRALCELTQVLFALNRLYFIGDKGALEEIDALPIRPAAYGERARALLARVAVEPVAAMNDLGALIGNVVDLAGDLYASTYALPGQ